MVTVSPPPTEYGSLRVSHRGRQCATRIGLAGTGLRFLIGCASWRDVVRGVSAEGPPSVANLKKIWRHFASAFGHVCDNGSPIDEVAERETSLQRYGSYSFGSCRDINLMLADALAAAGYAVRPLRSAEHVALQVGTPDGPFYVDADLNVLRRGPIASLASLGQSPCSAFRDTLPGPLWPSPPTQAEWPCWPGDEMLFTRRRPRLLFRPIDMADPYNLHGVDRYHRYRARHTRVGEAWLVVDPRVTARGESGGRRWVDVEVTSPFVLLDADLTGVPAGVDVAVFTAGVETRLEPGSHRFGAKSLLGHIAPHAMLSNWGGHARRVYLHHLAGRIFTDSNAPDGSHQSLWLFEDGRELGPMIHGPDPSGPHRQQAENRVIIEQGHGVFRLYQDAHLVFSSSDGTDPVTNGRRYTYRVRAARPDVSVRGRYGFAFRMYFGRDVSPEGRVHLRFQYNQAVMPEWSSAYLVADDPGIVLSSEFNDGALRVAS